MNKRSKYKDLSKNTLLFSISGFGSKLISFLLVPLYTYSLSTADYGTVDLIVTTVQLLIPVLTLNIQDAILRFSLDKEYDKSDIMGAGVKVVFISSVILSFALFVLYKTKIIHLQNEYLQFLFWSYLLGSLNNCFSMYLKACDRINVLMISGLMNTFVICILNVIFLLKMKIGVMGYLYANVFGMLTSVIIMLFAGKIYKDIHFKIDNKILKHMSIYSLPLVVNSLAWWMNNAGDRYILTYFAGMSVNGVYSVSYKIPTILSTIQMIFYNAWSVSAIKEFDKNDEDGFIGNVYTMYSFLSCFVCSIIMLGNIFIARMLYAKEFFEAWQYVPFLLVGTVFNGIALFEGCLFTAVKRTGDVSKTTVMGAVINMFLNIILIPKWGATGAAFATMVGYFSVWAVRTFQLGKFIKMKVDWIRQFISLIIIFLQSIIAWSSSKFIYQVPLMVLFVFLQRRNFYLFLNKIKEKK